MSEKKKSGGALLGAAFLMATSAIGPGFLTQTATFTGQYQESFGFVILVSVILAAIAQLNIWRVLCVTGLRGQDVSNKVLPGLGYLVSILIVFGGLVFNIGNVGGGALGFNTLLGAVMNKIDTSDDKYYSSYYKHYGEYYHRSDEEAQIK